MSSTVAKRQFNRPTVVKSVAAVAAATMALLISVNLAGARAEARPVPGDPVSTRVCGPFDDPRTFPVERLGNHLVRCDYLVR